MLSVCPCCYTVGLVINFIHHNWPKLLKHNFVEEFITPIVKVSIADTLCVFNDISFVKIRRKISWTKQNISPEKFVDVFFNENLYMLGGSEGSWCDVCGSVWCSIKIITLTSFPVCVCIQVTKKGSQERSFYSLPEFERWKSETENQHLWKVHILSVYTCTQLC